MCNVTASVNGPSPLKSIPQPNPNISLSLSLSHFCFPPSLSRPQTPGPDAARPQPWPDSRRSCNGSAEGMRWWRCSDPPSRGWIRHSPMGAAFPGTGSGREGGVQLRAPRRWACGGGGARIRPSHAAGGHPQRRIRPQGVCGGGKEEAGVRRATVAAAASGGAVQMGSPGLSQVFRFFLIFLFD